MKDTGILSWKQRQPAVEKTQTWMKKIMRIFPLQHSNKRNIESAVVSGQVLSYLSLYSNSTSFMVTWPICIIFLFFSVLGRWTRKIIPDTPDPECLSPNQYDKVTSDLDNKLEGKDVSLVFIFLMIVST